MGKQPQAQGMLEGWELRTSSFPPWPFLALNFFLLSLQHQEASCNESDPSGTQKALRSSEKLSHKPQPFDRKEFVFPRINISS